MRGAGVFTSMVTGKAAKIQMSAPPMRTKRSCRFTGGMVARRRAAGHRPVVTVGGEGLTAASEAIEPDALADADEAAVVGEPAIRVAMARLRGNDDRLAEGVPAGRAGAHRIDWLNWRHVDAAQVDLPEERRVQIGDAAPPALVAQAQHVLPPVEVAVERDALGMT